MYPLLLGHVVPSHTPHATRHTPHATRHTPGGPTLIVLRQNIHSSGVVPIQPQPRVKDKATHISLIALSISFKIEGQKQKVSWLETLNVERSPERL